MSSTISTCSNSSTLTTDQYLTHYWSFDGGEMTDHIGTSDMTQGNLTLFTTDRFGNANSALALNGGWVQVKSGIYFDTPEFTISVWIYPQLLGSNSRVIDFGDGQSSNNTLLAFYQYSTASPYFKFYNGSTKSIVAIATSTQRLALCQWQLLTVTFSSILNSTFIYINGQMIVNLNQSYTPPTINSTRCYVGRSNWQSDGISWSYLDDLRFYNKSLSQCEIQSLMNTSSNFKN